MPSTSRTIRTAITCALIGAQALSALIVVHITMNWMRVEFRQRLDQEQPGRQLASPGGAGLQAGSQLLPDEFDGALATIGTYGSVLAMFVMTVGGLMTWLWVKRGERQLVSGETARHLDHRRHDELLRTRDAVILGLAKFAEFRDLTTSRHLDRIGSYVRILALCLREKEPERYPMLSDQYIDDLCAASALHDIGKVGIPDQVLFKPGRLSAEERALIEDHPIIGGECLSAMEQELGQSRFLSLAREIAYAHHEWWNGRGYPFKLEGEGIPKSARIVALADVYDALTSSRPYKVDMSHDQARKIILSGMGKQFDPFVVGAFLLTENQFKKIAEEMSRDDLALQQKSVSSGHETPVIHSVEELSELLC